MLEALRAGRDVSAVLLAEGTEAGPQVREILDLAARAAVPVVAHPQAELDRRSATKHHQGVIALVGDTRYSQLEEVLETARGSGAPALVVVLDGIQDPQNLGAIARTAEAAGAHGIVIPERRAVGVTPGALRASAGALEHIKVARVTNISRAIAELKEAGLWVIGLDMAADRSYTAADLTGPVAIVVGSEGEGIGRLVREKCDYMVALPLHGKVASLNASVAAAIVLYEAVRQRAAVTPGAVPGEKLGL